MSFNKYYQDELAFLRDMGREFAGAYPAVAPLLGESGSDPDVERLLEGVAFLSGRVRQKLDDEFPELTHGLMSLLWPHYLRPIPSISILEFSPIAGAVMEKQRIARGTEVASVPVDGTPCRFRTCFNVDMYPITLQEAGLEFGEREHAALRLTFGMSSGITLTKAKLDSLRLYISGEAAFPFYVWLSRHVEAITARLSVKGQAASEMTLPRSSLRPAGFTREEALLPYPKTAFEGYRLLQEYFAFPEKFLFIELHELTLLNRLGSGESFDIRIIFSRKPDPAMRVSRETFRLYCTPIVNLFSLDSDPIRVDHERVEYRIRPGGSNPLHYEIYSVDQAKGWVRGTAEERTYEPFYSFTHDANGSDRKAPYYQIRRRDAVVGDGTEIYAAFVTIDQEVLTPPSEVVEFRLTCTNRTLAGKLKAGDIKMSTESSPVFARFQNITNVTPGVPAPTGGDLYWRLISHLSLNYLSLANLQALQGILELYNFQIRHDRAAGLANTRRILGIVEMFSEPQNRLFRGVPVRGTAITIGLAEDHFAGEGDWFLFASVLNEFFALYASLNSFIRLKVRGSQQGEIYQWDAKIGEQILL